MSRRSAVVLLVGCFDVSNSNLHEQSVGILVVPTGDKENLFSLYPRGSLQRVSRPCRILALQGSWLQQSKHHPGDRV